jgi:hypothetical protein
VGRADVSAFEFGVIGALLGVDLLSLGTQQVVALASTPGVGEVNLLPQYCYVVMRTKVGAAMTTSPKIRMGSNGTHDDVAPLFTVPLATLVNVFALLPLVPFPFTPVNLRSVPVMFEVQQAGIGPTSCTGDVVLVGMKVG